ncbi:tyrosine-type recombinase/integrase [Paenibacillus polymyxa]
MKVQECKDLEKLLIRLDKVPPSVQSFIKTKIDNGLSPSSALEYVRDFGIFFNWASPKLWPDVDISVLTLQFLNDISPDHVQQYMNYLTSSRNLQYSSMLRKMHSLRSLFGFLHQEFGNDGYPILRRNVFASFTMSRPRNHSEVAHQLQKKILRANEIPAFIKFVQEDVTKMNNSQAQWFHNQNRDRDVSMITLLLESGILVSDLVNLDLNDICLQNGYIIVTRQHSQIRTKHRILFGESAKTYLHKYLRDRIDTYAPKPEEPALFLAKPNGELYGKRISKRTIQVMVKKYASKFGASEVTVRQLTHSFGFQYAERNNIRNMKQQLAQRNIESLEKYFILSSLHE